VKSLQVVLAWWRQCVQCTPIFLGPNRVYTPNGISFGSAVFGRPLVKRFALSYRTVVLSDGRCNIISVLSMVYISMVCPILSVTFVHCGQTVGRIKMKLAMQVGLGPGHSVLDGDSAPHGKWQSSPPHSKFTGAGFACLRIIRGPCLLWPNDWMDQDETWHGHRPRPSPNCVKWGPSSPPKGAQPPNFRPCRGQTAGWIKMQLGRDVLHGDPAPPSPKGHSRPIFGPCLLWPNGWLDQGATW